MFLIYNFHLSEAENQNFRELFCENIREIRAFDGYNDNEYLMSIYGLEAFFLSYLKGDINQNNLMSSWKKINVIWSLLIEFFKGDLADYSGIIGNYDQLDIVCELKNFLSEMEHLKIEKKSEKYYMILLINAYLARDFYKVATSLDHIIKYSAENSVISVDFVYILSVFFPFLMAAFRRKISL